MLPKVAKAPFVTRENGANSLMVNLSIAIKSNEFVETSIGRLIFEEKKK